MPTKRAKRSVREGEAGKKAKATHHAGGKFFVRESRTNVCPWAKQAP